MLQPPYLHYHKEKNQDGKASHPHWSQQRDQSVSRGKQEEAPRAGIPLAKRRKPAATSKHSLFRGLPLLTGFPLRKIKCDTLVHWLSLRPQKYMYTVPQGKTLKLPISFPDCYKTSKSNSEFSTAQPAVLPGTWSQIQKATDADRAITYVFFFFLFAMLSERTYFFDFNFFHQSDQITTGSLF